MFQFLTGGGTIGNDTGPIQVTSHLRYFSFYTVVIIVGILQRLGRLFLNGFHYQFRQFYCPFAPISKGIVYGKSHSFFLAMGTDIIHFFIRIISITVERNHNRLTEIFQITQMFVHIGYTLFQSFQIGFLYLIL